MKPVRAIGIVALLACVARGALADGPHVHGQARLGVVVEGPRITLELDAPLDGLVGFERAPRDARERATLEDAIEYLRSGKGFVPSAAAGCALASVKVNTPERGKGHMEVVAALAYECRTPGELKEIDAALLRHFKRLKRIDVRVVTSKGQAAARLTPGKPALLL